MSVVRWRGKWTVDLTLTDGTRIRRVSPVQTKRGAEEYAAALWSGSLTSTPSSTRGTEFRKFAVEWLETYAVANNRPSEVLSKESALRNHLLPFFENMTLDEINPRQIENYKAAKLKGVDGRRPLSPKTINNHLMVLRKCLATAQEWELIDRLPAIHRLKAPPAKFDWLRPEEAESFLAAIHQHYPQWRALFWLALRTGMRRGELFGLRWEDVDLVAGLVTVRHSLFRGKLVAPKSGRDRAIPLTATVREVLSAYRAETRHKGDLLFPGADGEPVRHMNHVNRPLHGALKLAGLRRIRFHDLRHTFASQLVSAGRSIKEVQELLGHQSIQVTMRYAHLAPERLREAVEILERPILRGQTGLFGTSTGTFLEHQAFLEKNGPKTVSPSA